MRRTFRLMFLSKPLFRLLQKKYEHWCSPFENGENGVCTILDLYFFFFPLFPVVLEGILPKVMRSAPFRGLAKRFVDFSAFDFCFRLVAFCAGKNACVLRKLNVTAFSIFILKQAVKVSMFGERCFGRFVSSPWHFRQSSVRLLCSYVVVKMAN